MRITRVLAAFLALGLSGVPALAQPDPPAVKPQPVRRPMHPTGQRPVDNGPYTPEANRAYQGGGVVLQGAPGAPAPAPQATPQGEAPRISVPQ